MSKTGSELIESLTQALVHARGQSNGAPIVMAGEGRPSTPLPKKPLSPTG